MAAQRPAHPAAHDGARFPDVVGLVPAAGRATRIAPLPVSKELLPVGLEPPDAAGRRRLRVAAHGLLGAFVDSGIGRAVIVLGQGKWDIPAFLDDGADLGLHLAYVTVRDSRGAAFTVDRAYAFTGASTVALGFPDILFAPSDAYRVLLERQADRGADVVLGLFPTATPWKSDMVDRDDDGTVRRILVKPPATDLPLTWITAVWSPAFSSFLHDHAARDMVDRGRTPGGGEVHIGDVIQAAITAGLAVDSVAFPGGSFRDIGTPDDLAATLRDIG